LLVLTIVHQRPRIRIKIPLHKKGSKVDANNAAFYKSEISLLEITSLVRKEF